MHGWMTNYFIVFQFSGLLTVEVTDGRILKILSRVYCFNNGSFELLLPGLNWALFYFLPYREGIPLDSIPIGPNSDVEKPCKKFQKKKNYIILMRVRK